MESPEINPHTYGQLICDKGDKNIRKVEKTFSSMSGVRKTGQLHIKDWDLEHFLIPYTKMNSNGLKINVRLETTKLPEKNIGSTLFDRSYSNVVLHLSFQARETSKNK